MSVTDNIQDRTEVGMRSRERFFFMSLFLSTATSHGLQLCTDVLKGFYQAWNRRSKEKTDFFEKTARHLFTLFSLFVFFVCSVYISIPPYSTPYLQPPPCLSGRIRYRCLWLPAVNPPGLIKVTGAGTVNHGRSKTWEPAG